MRNFCSNAFLFHNAGLGILRRNRRGSLVLSRTPKNRLFLDRSSDGRYARIVCTLDIGPVFFPARRTRISPAVARHRFDCGVPHCARAGCAAWRARSVFASSKAAHKKARLSLDANRFTYARVLPMMHK